MNKFYTLLIILAFKISVNAQNLLNIKDLDTCTVFSSIEEALKTPEKVLILDLSANNLNDIPEKIVQFKNLQVLNLANNSITKLPNEIFELKNLQILNLEENRLKKLPEEIAQLQNLYNLNLTRTKIPSIPESFSKLKKLKILNLSWNGLKDDSIKPVFKLKQLQDLNLMRNQIEVLDSSICEMDSLLYLNLNFNPIKKLPENMGNLQQLIELDLGKNTELKSLPDSFKKLIHLEYLNLESVPLSYQEKKKLPKLPEDVIEL